MHTLRAKLTARGLHSAWRQGYPVTIYFAVTLTLIGSTATCMLTTE